MSDRLSSEYNYSVTRRMPRKNTTLVVEPYPCYESTVYPKSIYIHVYIIVESLGHAQPTLPNIETALGKCPVFAG